MKKAAFVILFAALLTALFSCEKTPEKTSTESTDATVTGERTFINADDYGGYSFMLYSDNTCELIGVDLSRTGLDVTLPENYDEYRLVAICDSAFENSKLTSISIPESVTRIGKKAFRHSALTEITLPSALTALGEDAFADCVALSKVSFPATLNEIPTGAFFGCTALSAVSIPEGCRVIGEEAFAGCTALESVLLPETLLRIEAYAFWSSGTDDLDFAIPASVAAVGSRAFAETAFFTSHTEEFFIVGGGVLLNYNGNKADVVIPDGVIFLSDAFRGKTLRTLTVPDAVMGAVPDLMEDAEIEQVIVSPQSPIVSLFSPT